VILKDSDPVLLVELDIQVTNTLYVAHIFSVHSLVQCSSLLLQLLLSVFSSWKAILPGTVSLDGTEIQISD